MTVLELLARLNDRDVALALSEEGLVVRGDDAALADEALMASLRANKAALVDMIRLGTYVGPAGSGLDVPPNRIPPGCTAIVPEMLLLVALTQAQIDAIVRGVAGGASNLQDVYPLAPLQEGILFHHRTARAGDAYLTPALFGFDTRERVDNFVAALQGVVDRHDILRTAIAWEDLPEPVQVVWRKAALAVDELVLDPSNGDVAQQLRARFDPRRFRLDVRSAPLLRLAVAEDRSRGRWVVLLLFHHLAIDHTTLDVVMHETQAHLRGEQHQLPRARPFRDYVARARRGLSAVEHEAFFRDMLADVDEPTAPFGAVDIQGDGAEVAEHRHPVEAALSRRLRERARQLGVSVASVFHLAFAQVLARLSGRDDVVFGTLLFGRMQGGEGADRALGLFINTLPLRLQVDARPVQEAVRATHDRLAQLMRHEHAPLALAQRCSGVAAPLPLFGALLNYRHSAGATAQPEWEGMSFEGSEERTTYPLTLSVDDLGDGFVLTAQARAPGEPRRIVASVHTALERLADALERAPDTALHDLDTMPDAERLLLLEWGVSPTRFAGERCVHPWFEERAAAAPDAPAVRHGERQLTYAQLNAAANRLAHHLRARGVEAGCRVAIGMERSMELVVAELAVLKCGAAYVPLDVQAPPERQSFVMADCQAAWVLAQGALRLPQLQGLVRIDVDAVALDAHSPDNLACAIDAGAAAYVMYTSGSTGQPKGVVVPHRAIRRLAIDNGYAEFRAGDRVAFGANPAFDATTMEVWAPLLTGGCIVVVDQDTLLDPQRLARTLADQRVDVLWMTVGLFNRHADRLAEVIPQLRYLIVGGDTLDPVVIERVLRRHPPAHLLNAYGPTETTTFATMHEIRAVLPGRAIPIGRPIADTRICILDGHGRPAPVGVAGEIHIGGAGVASGYLNRPELTAQRFVADPLGDGPHARMYRTGDLARWLPDGTIEFIGRNDQQVKIRGFRVEPGEVESRLSECPGVRQAAVVAREDTPGDKRLVAYVAGDGLDAAALRSRLAEMLPEYMVPAACVAMAALPLNANGKVDRKALPAPEAGAVAARMYEAPANEAERVVAAIWSEALQIGQVGRHDNFFELGGHSLLAVTVIERLRQAGLHADVRALFNAPTLAALAAGLGGGAAVEVPPNLIPEGCKAITPAMLPLASLTQAQIDRVVATVPGGAANVQDIYPLAPLQEGLLFHHLMESRGDVYLTPALLAFDTRERLDRFVAALQAVIDRHDILRTSIVWDGLAEPVQVVWRHAPLQLEQTDLAGADVCERLRERFDPRQVRIDPARAPLIGGGIAHDAAHGRWALLLLFHHLAIDHTTLEVMLQEIQSHLLGEQHRLPRALPFRNFVAQARAGVAREEHEAFFREMLGDVDEPTLPFGLADVQGHGDTIAEAQRPVDAPLARRLRERARLLGVSVASLVHVAWALVLARVSGRDDVVFGSVLFGRMQGGEGADRVLGLFINTLPLRVRIDEAEGSEHAVRQAHERLGRLMRHEHASLALAQRCSGVAAPTPLFTSLLNYRHSAGPTSAAPAWHGVEQLAGEERTNYPLTLSVDDLGDGFNLTAQVRATVDPQRVCDLMHTALERLADALEQAPQTPLRVIDVLPDAERRRLLAWNMTPALPAHDRCIHQLFEAQAARRPGAAALVWQQERLAYGELNARANRLARHLRRHGVGPDTRVAVCVERGIDMVVGMLAILKAGGAYVPLDPAYPIERLIYMVQDCGAPVLLTQAGLAVLEPLRAALHSGAAVVELDTQADRWANEDATDLQASETGLRPEHLAYVIYTSGSTGQPKGVMVTHANVARLFAATQPWFGFDVDDVWTLFHSFAFDFSVWEMWGALMHGGRLVVVPYMTSRSPQDFHALVCHEGVTVLNQTPSAFRQFIAAQGEAPDLVHRLRTIVFGGEALELATLEPWYERAGNRGTRLVNMYGITETTVHVSYRPLMPSDCEQAGGASPIGVPIPDLRIHVLDAQRRPVPIGVPGEMYVGGAGVARGYLNRPELTAERFIDDPFDPSPGARMYKTGDLARRLDDGSLEFLGRNDHQVKIRGFRIELGEIEAALLAQPSVREAVVIAREDEPGRKRLAAYVVFDPAQPAPAPADLRGALSQRLPEFMLPAHVVALERLPLTPNGKLDRRALPAPDTAGARVGTVAPRTPVEAALASIWAEALGLEQVGVDDNFFAIGGDSIRAITVLSKARERGLSFALVDLFRHPTVEQLAQALGACSGDEAPGGEASLLAEADRAALPPGVEDAYGITLLQTGMVFHHQLSGDASLYHDVFGYRLTLPSWDEAAFRAALATMVRRHPVLRTSLRFHGYSEPLQLVHHDAHIPLEVVDLSAHGDAAQRQMLAAFLEDERRRDFVLEAPPLLRVFMHLCGGNTVHYTLSFHHAILDGWSVAALQTELFQRYLGLLDGDPSALRAEPLAVTPKAVVARERSALASAAHRQFWRQLLDGHMFTGLPAHDGCASAGAEQPVIVDEAVRGRLRGVAERLGVPMRSVLLCAHLRVLALLSGRDDVTTGLVSNVRLEQADGDRVLGLFLNTLPFRQAIAGGRWSDLIRQTFETELEVLRHRHYPYFQLYLDNGRTPLYETAFNYVNFHVYEQLDRGERFGIAGSQSFEATDFALMTSFSDTPQQLAFDVKADPGRLSAAQLTRVRGYYLAVLQAMADDVQAPHDSMLLLSEAERGQLLVEWNATQAEYPSQTCIHELIEAQVRRTPDAPAVVGVHTLTYAELNTQANRLARHLRRLGVRPDTRVGVCMRRDEQMVVALLAILKAGGAYVA
ncbi:MAG TPA: amino acid adenylation domain-containing protein, partial [Albitalea sp.]